MCAIKYKLVVDPIVDPIKFNIVVDPIVDPKKYNIVVDPIPLEQDREPHFLYWSRTEPIKQVHVPRGSTNPAKPEMEIRFRQSPLSVMTLLLSRHHYGHLSFMQ